MRAGRWRATLRGRTGRFILGFNAQEVTFALAIGNEWATWEKNSRRALAGGPFIEHHFRLNKLSVARARTHVAKSINNGCP
jgi:hypothetical protein